MERVVFRNVTKRFHMNAGRKLLRGHVQDLVGGSGREWFYALHDVSVSLSEGESLAIIGSNGAGKSTTIEILEGYRDRSGGEARVLGIDPGSQRTGFGIIDCHAGGERHVASGCIDVGGQDMVVRLRRKKR